MSDNVVILGAGFSHSAGIPLLGGIVEGIWECAVRPLYKGKKLTSEDKSIFNNAMEVMHGLDSYHGRAGFDDRNIEDILSLLSFSALGGNSAERRKLKAVTKALARIIELRCTVKHPGLSHLSTIVSEGPDLYRNFWKSIFSLMDSGQKPPTIVTLNYDLVLERSMLQVLIGDRYFGGREKRVPFPAFSVNYHSKNAPEHTFEVEYVNFQKEDFSSSSGVRLKLIGEKPQGAVDFDILKLHGSLNFSERTSNNELDICRVQETPSILPPIFNKLSTDRSAPAWGVALDKIREAKNIVIVGYSLPRTDIYMQYFLKAALGPNQNLNRITVFDPVLFEASEVTQDMERRYRECFSPQLQKRIVFRPAAYSTLPQGTAQHFVGVLGRSPSSIFF